MSLLANAIRDNDLPLVRDLIASGVNINRGPALPLNVAIREQNVDIVELLLSQGAELQNSYGDYPIMVAIQTGNLTIVDMLVRAGSQVNAGSSKKEDCTPLYMAVLKSHPEIVNYLLCSGAEVNTSSPHLYSGNTALHQAATMMSSEGLVMVNILLQANADVQALNEEKQTPLHSACDAGNSEAMQRLVQCGAKLNDTDKAWKTPLHLAAAAGHDEVVRHLCVAGASINMVNKSGRTPLHEAVIYRQLRVMKTLLRFKASVDKGNPSALQRSPLLEVIRTCPLRIHNGIRVNHHKKDHYLGINREIETLDTLLQGGASLKYQDDDGNSCLHLCVRHATEDELDYLINRGADPTLVNKTGQTALSLACGANQEGMVIKLLQLCPAAVSHPNNHGLSLDMKSPFLHLCKNSNIKALRFLMEAGYRPTRAEIDLCNFYDNDRDSSAVTLWSEKELSQPWSLLRASRSCVRELLNNDLKRKVYKLPIPQKLREDILLESPYLLYADS